VRLKRLIPGHAERRRSLPEQPQTVEPIEHHVTTEQLKRQFEERFAARRRRRREE
jgi:hypothetical protein